MIYAKPRWTLLLMIMKGTIRPLLLLASAFLLLGFALPADADRNIAPNSKQVRIHIDRKGKTLYAIDAKGAVVAKYPIGIGKGPLNKTKRSMSDNITPIGEFTVELILSKNAKDDAVERSFLKKYHSVPDYLRLVESQSGLAQLYLNMNSIDFNADGKPDNAYGSAYIGLTSRAAVTGPKMRTYAKVPYWYSIAIHGTPDPDKAIRQATSGGCVHLGEDGLMKLIDEKFVKVGTPVTIADAPPS